jgi:hypothetical protein
MSPNGFDNEVAARGHGCVNGASARWSSGFEFSVLRSYWKAGLIHVLGISAYPDRRG